MSDICWEYDIAYSKLQKDTCNESKTENILNRQFQNKEYRDVVISALTYVRVGGRWNYIYVLVDFYNQEISDIYDHNNRTCMG